MTHHYHGGPIWGDKEISYHELMPALWRNGGALISYAYPQQLKNVVNIPCKLVLDCGAYTTWNSDKRKHASRNWEEHWQGYYDKMVAPWFSRIEWFLIPDVIEGTEEENDRLLQTVPGWLKSKAVPVWHSDESLERFIRLCEEYPRVAIGCCGPHRRIRSAAWLARMQEVFTAIYIDRDLPVKIHGLRMLDGRVLSMFPFDSADSSSVATNVPKTEKVIPEEPCKLKRTAILRAAKELITPPTVKQWRSTFAKIDEPLYDTLRNAGIGHNETLRLCGYDRQINLSSPA